MKIRFGLYLFNSLTKLKIEVGILIILLSPANLVRGYLIICMESLYLPIYLNVLINST